MDYVNDVARYASNVSEAAVAGIVRHCGIALRSQDAAMVACSSKEELKTVRENFLQNRLGLTAEEDILDEAVEEVCQKMGISNRSKSRVTFYYLLAEKFGKLALFE